jgi:predicted tellurium resistance membrane protein TerC
MSRFAVPREQQQKVLMVGIIIALVLRAGFILAGAAIIEQFVWVFYLFGAFLIYTAIKLLAGEDEEEYKENVAIRLLRRVVPVWTPALLVAWLATLEEEEDREPGDEAVGRQGVRDGGRQAG